MIRARPDLLGIGIDEDTAIVVRGDRVRGHRPELRRDLRPRAPARFRWAVLLPVPGGHLRSRDAGGVSSAAGPGAGRSGRGRALARSASLTPSPGIDRPGESDRVRSAASFAPTAPARTAPAIDVDQRIQVAGIVVQMRRDADGPAAERYRHLACREIAAELRDVDTCRQAYAEQVSCAPARSPPARQPRSRSCSTAAPVRSTRCGSATVSGRHSIHLLERGLEHRQQKEVRAFAHVEANGARLVIVAVVDQLVETFAAAAGDPVLFERRPVVEGRAVPRDAERVGDLSATCSRRRSARRDGCGRHRTAALRSPCVPSTIKRAPTARARAPDGVEVEPEAVGPMQRRQHGGRRPVVDSHREPPRSTPLRGSRRVAGAATVRNAAPLSRQARRQV